MAQPNGIDHALKKETTPDEIEYDGYGKDDLTRTQSVVTITPELFEKLYLGVKAPRTGDAVKRFANPTPLGFVGFVISALTFSMVLMGFGGANGSYALAGMFMFVGPILLLLSTIFEWLMGNFFPMMVMGLFTVFWLSFGFLQLPTLGLAAAYSESGTNAAEGAAAPAYNVALALYLIVWGLILFTFFIFTLKINMVFAAIFFFVTLAAFVLAGAYFKVASGDYGMATNLQTAGGALIFIVGLLGWYSTFVMMAYEMRLGVSLPVGDLSHYWPRTDVELGKTE